MSEHRVLRQVEFQRGFEAGQDSLRQRVAVLEKALRWYEERAKAIGHIDKGKDYQAAVYTELTLDSGTRARKALADGE